MIDYIQYMLSDIIGKKDISGGLYLEGAREHGGELGDVGGDD